MNRFNLQLFPTWLYMSFDTITASKSNGDDTQSIRSLNMSIT